MSLLDQIVAEGNRTFDTKKLKQPRLANKIRCADGFELSVIAGDGTYCSPRPDDLGLGLGDAPPGYSGPFFAVEVGYPSERPEPWHCSAWHDGYDDHSDHPECDGWEKYAETPEEPTSTVYGYVPVHMVRVLVESHGGEA